MQFKTIYNKPLYKNSHWVDLSTVQGAKGSAVKSQDGQTAEEDICASLWSLQLVPTASLKNISVWFRNTAATDRLLFVSYFFPRELPMRCRVLFEWAGAGTEIHLPFFVAKRAGQQHDQIKYLYEK